MRTVTLKDLLSGTTIEVIDHAEALHWINKVREAWGWTPLPGLPKASPMHICNCVLGRSWEITLSGSDLVSGTSLRFETPEQTRLAAEALGVPYDPKVSLCMLRINANHPLVRWMVAFDHQAFPELTYEREAGDKYLSQHIDVDEDLVPVD